MNIVHLVTSSEWGSPERYVLDLARAQRADGHTVKVITRRREAVSAPFAAEGLHGCTMRFGGGFDVFTPVRLAKQLDALAGAGALTVVHAHSLRGASAAQAARRLMQTRNARVKLIYTHHTVSAAPETAAARRLLAEIDSYVFVSEAARTGFLSTAPELDATRMHTAGSAIVAERYPKAGRAGSDKAVHLIFCGRLTPEKGLDVLMRTLANLKHLSWTLEVCGTGRSRDVMPVVRLARGLDVDSRIDWRGFEEAPLARMARADALVLPSTAPEPAGTVILEAFSQGLPVVASDIGVPGELIADGSEGLLVKPGDIDSLTQALERIISDDALRHNMAARAAAAYDTRHSYSTFYRTIINVYNS